MEPVASGVDRILIDVSRRVPVPPGILVIRDAMGLVTKRRNPRLFHDPSIHHRLMAHNTFQHCRVSVPIMNCFPRHTMSMVLTTLPMDPLSLVF